MFCLPHPGASDADEEVGWVHTINQVVYWILKHQGDPEICIFSWLMS